MVYRQWSGTRFSKWHPDLPGGVPIYRGDQLIGGIGVSGDGVDQDDMIGFLGLAQSGLAGSAPQHAPVNRVPINWREWCASALRQLSASSIFGFERTGAVQWSLIASGYRCFWLCAHGVRVGG